MSHGLVEFPLELVVIDAEFRINIAPDGIQKTSKLFKRILYVHLLSILNTIYPAAGRTKSTWALSMGHPSKNPKNADRWSGFLKLVIKEISNVIFI